MIKLIIAGIEAIIVSIIKDKFSLLIKILIGLIDLKDLKYLYWVAILKKPKIPIIQQKQSIILYQQQQFQQLQLLQLQLNFAEFMQKKKNLNKLWKTFSIEFYRSAQSNKFQLNFPTSQATERQIFCINFPQRKHAHKRFQTCKIQNNLKMYLTLTLLHKNWWNLKKRRKRNFEIPKNLLWVNLIKRNQNRRIFQQKLHQRH